MRFCVAGRKQLSAVKSLEEKTKRLPLKLIAVYNVPDLDNLEYNHRKYADKHGLAFEKIVLGTDSLAERYFAYLECLQKNIGETIMFVDNFTYFVNFDHLPKLERDALLQKQGNTPVTGLFIVRSNEQTLRIFERASHSVNTGGFRLANWQEVKSDKIKLPDSFTVQYPYRHDGVYLCTNIYTHNNIFSLGNKVLAITFLNPRLKCDECDYYADAVCGADSSKPEIPQSAFDCYNPGGKHAFVTMYTPNIAEIGILSEENVKRYCAKNNITYYVYRSVPDDLVAAGVKDAWVKPWLLLKHFDSHESISWIDSDILIGPDWKLDFNREIACFRDPLFTFNSGFMLFKSNEKNRALLGDVVASIMAIDGKLEGVYNHGGDQPRFIDAVLKHYPGYAPLSARMGNTHPGFPRSISTSESDKMLHFMGYSKHVRVALMAGYSSVLNKKYIC